MTIHDDIAEARAYADKGPALSRATAGRLVDEIEAQKVASEFIAWLDSMTNDLGARAVSYWNRPEFAKGVIHAWGEIRENLAAWRDGAEPPWQVLARGPAPTDITK